MALDEQHLTAIDIADPGHHALVEQGLSYGDRAALQTAYAILDVHIGIEQVWTER